VAFTKSKRSEYFGFDDFQASARKKSFAPVYLFIGKEDFLIEHCLDTIVMSLVPEDMKGFNLDVVYGSKADAKDIIAHASSFPMMGDRRVVIVKEFEKMVLGEASKDIVAKYLERPLDSTCLVLVSPEPDFRKRPFPDLKKSAQIYSMQPLYDNQVPAWISRQVELKGRLISSEACLVLQAYVGNSLRSLDNEIQKLFIFAGEKKEITVEDVSSVVSASKSYSVFDLQNCIGRRDTKGALVVLSRMLEAGENPQGIIVMLCRFFTVLLKIWEGHQRRIPEQQIAAESRINSFFMKQYFEYSSNFTPDHIESSFRALLRADADLKSSMGDRRVVLDLMVYALTKNPENVLRTRAS
jgi:DNA polymerase-3 subunit delta